MDPETQTLRTPVSGDSGICSWLNAHFYLHAFLTRPLGLIVSSYVLHFLLSRILLTCSSRTVFPVAAVRSYLHSPLLRISPGPCLVCIQQYRPELLSFFPFSLLLTYWKPALSSTEYSTSQPTSLILSATHFSQVISSSLKPLEIILSPIWADRQRVEKRGLPPVQNSVP